LGIIQREATLAKPPTKRTTFRRHVNKTEKFALFERSVFRAGLDDIKYRTNEGILNFLNKRQTLSTLSFNTFLNVWEIIGSNDLSPKLMNLAKEAICIRVGGHNK
jgi:hypothetical protein